MHLNTSAESHAQTVAHPAPRKDPQGFILTLSLVLFTLTCAAMITMQLAVKYGWQLI